MNRQSTHRLMARTERRALDREVARLAVPAFFALVAEPLLLLTDSAVVGRLGTEPLAGLGVASAVLTSAVGLFVFLAYGTTAAVARRSGAGDLRAALAQGVDGAWLALGLGTAAAVVGWAAAPALVGAFGPSDAVAEQAVTYLRWSMPGLPAMLLVLATTGVLRGLQDTRTPLVVAAVGAAANAPLSVLLVHGADLGIAGAAIGTVLAQLGMAAWLLAVVVRAARRAGAPLRPHSAGIGLAGRAGVPLLVRTLALRCALLLTTYVATAQGDAPLAAHQVAMSVWSLLAFALDALAIAAQALTGRALGAGDVDGARALVRRLVRLSLLLGVLLGALVALSAPLLARVFTPDPDVRSALVAALLVAAVTQPLAAWVFLLDGVLIGAGDGAYLARAGVLVLVAYAPLALAVLVLAPRGQVGLAWLWASFAGGFMAVRLVTLVLRERTGRWAVAGAVR